MSVLERRVELLPSLRWGCFSLKVYVAAEGTDVYKMNLNPNLLRWQIV